MYDRTRHLDLSVCLENLALVKRTLREQEGNPLPDEWRVSYIIFLFYFILMLQYIYLIIRYI